MNGVRGAGRQRRQDLSPQRMWQGLSCLWHPAHLQDWQEGSIHEPPTSSPMNLRARTGEPEEAVCTRTTTPYLYWADGHAHHLHNCSAAGIKTLHLLRYHHPYCPPAHSHTLRAMLGSCPRNYIQSNVRNTRRCESSSCSTLLFKVTLPTATHTTMIKFWEASLECHSLYFIFYCSSHTKLGEEEGQQQECRPLNIGDTSVDHKAWRRTSDGEKSSNREWKLFRNNFQNETKKYTSPWWRWVELDDL